MDVVWGPRWSPQEGSLTKIHWPWRCLDDYHEPDNCFELKPPSPWLRVTNNRSVWNAARRWQSLGSEVSQCICEVVSTVEAWGRLRILNKQLPFLPKWHEPWAFRGSAFARKVKPGGLRTAVWGAQQEALRWRERDLEQLHASSNLRYFLQLNVPTTPWEKRTVCF